MKCLTDMELLLFEKKMVLELVSLTGFIFLYAMFTYTFNLQRHDDFNVDFSIRGKDSCLYNIYTLFRYIQSAIA